MRLLALLLTLLLALPARATDGIQFNPAPGYTTLQSDGVSMTRRRTVNFAYGLACFDDPGNNRTVCGMSSGGVYTKLYSLGLTDTTTGSTTITGLSYITASSAASCSIVWVSGLGASYGTRELYQVADVVLTAGDFVAGTGFTVYGLVRNGASSDFSFLCLITP